MVTHVVTKETMTSTIGTTELHKPNYGSVEKNSDSDDDRKKYEPSGLVMLLIALVVMFVIAVILVAFAYHRYRRNRSDKNTSSTVAKSYQTTNNGTVAIETQTNPSPVKSPSPKKPARSSLKQNQPRIISDNVLLDVSQGKFVSQSDQFVPGSRDNVSWNLPFIDASRETLDNLDETQPVAKRTGAISNENEVSDSNLPDASGNIDKVSQSSLERNADDLEREPMLRSDEKEEDDDDVFDDKVDCPNPRSPSEEIELLFRMSLSGENEDHE